MTNHLLGGDMDMTRDEYSKMRGSSVREVSATHGTISFKDVLLFYKKTDRRKTCVAVSKEKHEN